MAEISTEKHEKTLKKLREKLGYKKAKAKDKQSRLNQMKGNPITLKNFLNEVVLKECRLCPPTCRKGVLQ